MFQVFLLEAFHVVAVPPGVVCRPIGFAMFGAGPIHGLLVWCVAVWRWVTVAWASCGLWAVDVILLILAGFRLWFLMKMRVAYCVLCLLCYRRL